MFIIYFQYHTGLKADFKFYGKPLYFTAKMVVYPSKEYCQLVGSCIFELCHFDLKEESTGDTMLLNHR